LTRLDGHTFDRYRTSTVQPTAPRCRTPNTKMHSFLFIVLATILAFATAIPITPSAPRLQKRAEQFRLQGLKEACRTYVPNDLTH
jgi:hypothetical protein